jgi:selenide,water dikinase
LFSPGRAASGGTPVDWSAKQTFLFGPKTAMIRHHHQRKTEAFYLPRFGIFFVLVASIWSLVLSSNLCFSLSMTNDMTRGMKRIVLVGGGHAHVQVIKALNKVSRPKDVHVTLVDLQSSVSYSGMVPACVAGMYRPDQTKIHLQPLAEWAGIDFISGQKAVDIDPLRNKLYLQPFSPTSSRASAATDAEMVTAEQTVIDFDVVSFDIGSASRGLKSNSDTSWQEHVIPTRPIWELVHKIETAEEDFDSRDSPENIDMNIAVVGGGPAGIELAMAMRARWKKYSPKFPITLLDAGSQLIPNESDACRRALLDILSRKEIKVIHNIHVQSVIQNELTVKNKSSEDEGSTFKRCFSHCFWATGAAPHALASNAMKERGLSVSDQGWIRVSPTLQTLSHEHIFAAGDCVTIEQLEDGKESPPKAGVYAVRSGPILVENLTNFLEGKPLKKYDPQDDFLKLIMCGDGTALGFRFGLPLQGPWVWNLKNDIDQKFMNLFKKENLPTLKEGDPYDTKQYDEEDDQDPPIDPEEASALLQRTDDGVDIQQASRILRDMRDDEAYMANIVSRIKQSQEVVQT